MAKSRFEYVKAFESPDSLLPNCWIVVRIDGKNFHRFSSDHAFEKPNDRRSLDLMNRCAMHVMHEFGDVVYSYGQSDEFSFILKKDTTLFKRRSRDYFESPLQYPPTFDSRCIVYPSYENIRDYISWRQADCHINNLYNTCFWSLVHGGLSEKDAHARLRGTLSDTKNEILFSEFGINYNDIDLLYRKGSVLIREDQIEERLRENGERYQRTRQVPVVLHCDVIRDDFWAEHSSILGHPPTSISSLSEPSSSS